MAKWKPVIIDRDGDFEGLMAIEELENYEDSKVIDGGKLLKNSKKRKNNGRTKEVKAKKQKRKQEKALEDDSQKEFSKLSEMKSWACFDIRNEILSALYDKNFLEPTEIQKQCLGPSISGKRDILGAAETGSGKTLAFGIPIINGILNMKEELTSENEDSEVDEEDWEDGEKNIGCVKVKNLKKKKQKNKLQALILAPTRELAVQVKDHLTDICKYTNIRIVLLVGGLATEKQERLLKKEPQIVIATPGRLWELIVNKNEHLQNISKIRYLAIDETDRMLEKGHFEELNELLEKINANEKDKKERQNFVFSATLTIVHDPPSYLKGKKKKRITPGQKLQQLIDRIGITNPKVIDITNTQVTAENLIEYKIICKFEEKDYYLFHFLSNHSGRTIIFCNSIGCVKRLANLLTILEFQPLPLHAQMEQRQRLKNLDKFKMNENSLLLATDVAARGLDIPNVNHVVHYQVPKTAETYVHRSGRTARGRNVGDALLLIEPQEHKTYIKLIRTLGKEKDVEDLLLETDTMAYVIKVVKLARNVDELSLALRRDNSSKNWYKKAMEEADLLLDEDEIPKKISDQASKKIKKELQIKQQELKSLLKKPALPKKFSGKFPDINVSKFAPVDNARRDKLNIPGTFVLMKIPTKNS